MFYIIFLDVNQSVDSILITPVNVQIRNDTWDWPFTLITPVEWMSVESKALLLINFVPIELFKIKLKQVHCDVCFTKWWDNSQYGSYIFFGYRTLISDS